MEHLAIVGLPRSGSTLLYRLIHFCYSHHYIFFDEEERAFNKMGMLNHKPSKGLCTKKPGDTDCWRIIESRAADMGVNLTWILTLRDPRDILVSNHPEGKDSFAINWDTHNEEGVGLKYRMESAIDLWKHSRYPVKPIRYEDLVRKPSLVQIGLFCDLPTHRRFDDYGGGVLEPSYHASRMRGVRAIDQNSIGRWRNYAGRVSEQLWQCPSLITYAKELGYELASYSGGTND